MAFIDRFQRLLKLTGILGLSAGSLFISACQGRNVGDPSADAQTDAGVQDADLPDANHTDAHTPTDAELPDAQIPDGQLWDVICE